MKILHVIHVPFAIPYFLGDQLKYFKDSSNAEIHIACSPSETFTAYSRKWEFIPYALKINRRVSPLTDIISIIKLTAYIRRNKFNVVVSHSPKGALIGTIAAFISGIKNNIYVRHGLFYETKIGFRLKMFKIFEKTVSFFSTKVICVSKSILEKSISDNLTNPNKLIMINKGSFNGIDTKVKFNPSNYTNEIVQNLKNRYCISKNDFVIGYVGRLSKDKGIIELYKAWKMLNLKHDNLKLILIGPIDERDIIEDNYLNEINCNSSIILTGLINDSAPFYKLMDIFILPSYREGLPTVVLEASAMELPVLTTKKTGCIDSIVENETGMFIDITPEDISNKICQYISNPSLRNNHGNFGRSFVKMNYEQTLMWDYLYKFIYS
jgi:glycosyltransferase involved in cell wall biosynthesis